MQKSSLDYRKVMSDINKLFYELIRVAIGTQAGLSRLPSHSTGSGLTPAEWEELFEMAVKQSLVGVCFVGLNRLGADADDPSTCSGQEDTFARIGMSEDLYFDWMGMAAQINMKNELVNEQCMELQKRLAAEGFRSSILKGQGVAALYRLHENDNDPSASSGTNENCCQDGPLHPKPSTINLSGFRQSGDIDIYVDCGREKAIEFARSVQGDVDWDYKHLHLKVYEDTAVEMHYVPEVFLNLRKNRKLQKWFRENQRLIFNEYEDENKNKSSLPIGEDRGENPRFVCPSVEFNLFYILLHTYRHFLYEGVGMRQLMDYFFVLQTNGSKGKEGIESKERVLTVIKQFGMTRFVKGVMWIMKEVFGMSEQLLLVEPDEKEGRYILSEVMTGGNFGHHDERLATKTKTKTKTAAVKKILKHNMHLLTHYPGDTLWAPVWIVYHWMWKRGFQRKLKLKQV